MISVFFFFFFKKKVVIQYDLVEFATLSLGKDGRPHFHAFTEAEIEVLLEQEKAQTTQSSS